MRTASLAALAIFFPVFVWAAGLVNINTANATLLDTLPGIGPSKAAAIIDYRTKNGPFATTSDIQNVSGIGSATFARLAKLITIDATNPISVAPPKPQLSVPETSYRKVQKVEQVTSTKTNTKTHEEAVRAPTAAPEIAAVGAAVLPASEQKAAAESKSRASGIFRSPWTIGFFGVVVLAGATFILF